MSTGNMDSGSGSVLCKNCNNMFRGNYCNLCGQSADTFRITFNELFHHIPHAFFHIDRGFFYTIKELAFRPGHSVREYLQGKRKYHFNPFLLLLLVGGFCSYLYSRFHFQTILTSVSIDKLELQSPSVAHKYFAYRTFFFCMVCSIGDYLFFLKRRFSLPEMMVANTFMFCAVLILQVILFPLLLLSRIVNLDYWVAILEVMASLVFLVVARVQFYNLGRNVFRWVKVILAVLIYLLVILMAGRYLVKPWLAE